MAINELPTDFVITTLNGMKTASIDYAPIDASIETPWDATIEDAIASSASVEDAITSSASVKITYGSSPGIPGISKLDYLKNMVANLSPEDLEEFIAHARGVLGPTPPKFKSTEEADAWMEENG